MKQKQNNAWVIEGRCSGGWWVPLVIRLTRREIRLAMKELRLTVGEFGKHLRIRNVVFV